MKKLVSLLVVVSALVASTAATAPAQPSQSSRDIVKTAAAAGQFKTLARLVTRAGLVGALEKPGPYTVFAPTDAAFAKVPKKTLDSLLADKAKLKAVLLYHVVPGKITAADVTKLTSAKTLNGKSVRIRVSGMNVFVDRAKVTKPDVNATNGVIHVVNRVLIPPAG
ncbi:MAG TPA: fasciclin domain-containing protein [Gaiella sp.]|nr:fasciclin domain-containing protein [Gaiella sp.]